jgi:two-component system LytT family response regulator
MIVDDQQAAIDLISVHISKIPELSLSSTHTDPITALVEYDKNPQELIFLDVEMPGLTGLEFVESLKAKYGNRMPKVIFTTGSEDYAMSGFDQGVADYLLKPISFKRFKIAVDRVLAGIENKQIPVEAEGFFFAESDNKKVRINFTDIVYIEAAGNYVTIAMKEKKLTIYNSMSAMQVLLPEKDFARIHKSFIASIPHIQALSGNEVIMTLGDKTKNLPIGVTYREGLLKKLKIG